MTTLELSKKSLLPLLVAFAVLLVPSSALAATEGSPRWAVTAVSHPTNFVAGDETGDDAYVVEVTNVGGASSDGEPITITDELPSGVSLDPSGAFGEDELLAAKKEAGANLSCLLGSCTFSGVLVPDDTLIVRFPVDVSARAAAEVTGVVRVSGGGAAAASMGTPTAISAAPPSFGISAGGASTAVSTTQAGAHPDLTTATAFNTLPDGSLAGDPKDFIDELPPGFAGDLVDTPTCPATVFLQGECPVDTQIGVTTITFTPKGVAKGPYIVPVYNLEPDAGVAAKLGFRIAGLFYEGDVSVRPGDYGLKTVFYNAAEGAVEVERVSLTVWGVPAEAIHDPLRWKPDGDRTGLGSFGHAYEGGSPASFFTNPTTCGSEPMRAQFTVTSWEHPNESESPPATAMSFGPIVGCDRLAMEPSLTAEVTSDSASSATGFDLDTKIPQTLENAAGLSTSALKKEVVTLPEGMTVNPSSGAGLGACSEQQYNEEGLQYVAGVGCPADSKLATVKILTPSLKEEVTGSLFLAQPYDNPFSEPEHPTGSLLALYLIARIPNRGVLVKSPGLVEPNLQTGRLTTTFDDLPPLPFSLATFQFNQGANAPLVTPPACGDYDVKAELTPYSEPEGLPLIPPIAPFPISTGVGGGACPSGGVPPVNPGITAGTLDNAAGSYSPLEIRITRNDGEQEITGFSAQLPAGLTGNLSGIPFCSEADIEAARGKSGSEEEASPSCPVASEIGHTIAEAGVGSVLAQAPGKLYLGGPYAGAPFSVVSVTSAHVGPFDLGTVVIHFPLEINPVTAAVTIPAGQADQIPHIIKGIVIHVRNIHAYISRGHFMLNPTSCTPSTLSATVIGGGANPVNTAGYDPVTVSSPFQAADCSSLKFEPKFMASTSGKTSKAAGASLHVDLAYPAGALGQDANIREVKVDLPKQLPSRLTTLQKACTAAQFNANPAGCPKESLIGTAKAVTPILPVPLEGPAYFVSHGGEAFPSLEIVLQGDGVTIVLTGTTFISKAGITSSTFKTVPDQPVTSFELTLPEGKFSALGTNKNLCKPTKTVTVKKKVDKRVKGKLVRRHGKLVKVTKKTTRTEPEPLLMPTHFVGQNGAEISQSTPVTVTGCPKAKVAKKAKKHAKKGKGKGKGKAHK